MTSREARRQRELDAIRTDPAAYVDARMYCDDRVIFQLRNIVLALADGHAEVAARVAEKALKERTGT